MIPLKNNALYFTLFGSILLFILPIILYSGYYVDDNIRVITGKPDWIWVGRTLADWLTMSLSMNKFIDDFSPMSLIIGVASFAYVLYYSINKTINTPSFFKIWPFIFLIANPFFMQNLTYRYDSLPMSIALSLSVFAFFYTNVNKKIEYALKITLLVISLELYQPCTNLFIMLSAISIIYNIHNEDVHDKVKKPTVSAILYLAAIIIYMLIEKTFHSDINLSRGGIVHMNELYATIKGNILEFFKISYFLIGGVGLFIFVLPIIIYWISSIRASFKNKEKFIERFYVICSPLIIFLCIWGPLLVINERISLPRELPTVGGIIFLNASILLKYAKKIKAFNYIPIALYIMFLLFCGVFINALKTQDAFNDIVYNSLVNNITNNPALYNVKEIKINGNMPISKVFSRKVKENPYLYTLTMATPEWISRAVLIRKGLNQIRISFEGSDKKVLVDIVKSKEIPVINNQFYMIYKHNNITYVWFK